MIKPSAPYVHAVVFGPKPKAGSQESQPAGVAVEEAAAEDSTGWAVPSGEVDVVLGFKFGGTGRWPVPSVGTALGRPVGTGFKLVVETAADVCGCFPS